MQNNRESHPNLTSFQISDSISFMNNNQNFFFVVNRDSNSIIITYNLHLILQSILFVYFHNFVHINLCEHPFKNQRERNR